MVPLSLAQLEAALAACLNHVPPRGVKWAKRSQAIAMRRLRAGLYKARVARKAERRRKK